MIDLEDELGIELEEVTPPPVPEVVSPHTPPWPPRLAFDLALGIDTEDNILDRYMITVDQWRLIRANPAFIREVVEHKRDMLDRGVTFRSKARLLAEEYLSEMDRLVTDKSIDPKVRLSTVQSIVRWAGLEPKEEKDPAAIASQQFNIQINI